MRSEPKRDVDAILQAGLESYIDGVPLLGLEKRILNRAFARDLRKRFAWWTLAAVACSLALATVWFPHPATTHPPTKSPTHTSLIARAVSAPPSADQGIASRQNRQEEGRRGSTLKEMKGVNKQGKGRPPRSQPGNFLFFAPLTQEERRISAAIQEQPAEIGQAIADAQVRSSEPINITTIHIEPLHINGQKDEENDAQHN